MTVSNKILVVDDELDILSLLEEVLKRRKYEVYSADTIDKALKILDKNKDIALVISDIKMPEGTGVDLLKKIRSIDTMKPVVVFLTAFTDISLEDVYDKGASGFIEKPLDLKFFVETIEKLLSDKRTPLENLSEEPKYNKELNIKLKSLESSSIGTGGMFVPMTQINVELNEIVKFEIHFETGEPSLIKGFGQILWVRNSQDLNKTGIGIKFIHINKDSEKYIYNLVKAKGIISFVPKD